MFSSPAIFGAPRHFTESSGVMPLNALNGSSSHMFCDENLTSGGLPSYEEAVTNGSMFGLFNVDCGDEIHQHDNKSPSHDQHFHNNDHHRPHFHHSLLTPKHSGESDGKPSNRHCTSVSRVTDATERLDLSSESSDSHATRLSRISVVSTLSVPRTPNMPSPDAHPHNPENKTAKGKASGKGSGGGRKYLTVDRSALSSAKERLYRVLSPVLTRKQEHQETSNKDGGYGKKNARDKDSSKVKTSPLPVRMCISSCRHRHSSADHFDDIRATEKERHKDGQHKRHNDLK